jgi:hypothetical protein
MKLRFNNVNFYILERLSPEERCQYLTDSQWRKALKVREERNAHKINEHAGCAEERYGSFTQNTSGKYIFVPSAVRPKPVHEAFPSVSKEIQEKAQEILLRLTGYMLDEKKPKKK